jgi:hypothetical protein
VGSWGTILKTSNGGTTWVSQVSGISDDLRGLFFLDENRGFAVGVLDNILKTTNGGAAWSLIHSGYGIDFNSVWFRDQNTGYVAGNGGAILLTTDGGTTWTPQLSGTHNDLTAICITDLNTGYTAGSKGTILRTTDNGVGLTSPTVISEPGLQVFPNPASEKLTLLPSGKPGKGMVVILDLRGRELCRMAVPADKNQIDISHLPSGVYFVRLTTDDKVETGRFIKQ